MINQVNNRFLQIVNPQISRALADGGSSLNPEIQMWARQMIDLGIYSDLRLWVNSGLLKSFIGGSPSTNRISAGYDISGNNRDFVTWPYITNSNPLLGSFGDRPVISFAGVATQPATIAFEGAGIPNNSNYSIILWVNPAGGGTLMSSGGATEWSTQLNVSTFIFVTGGVSYIIDITDFLLNEWNMYSITRNGSNYRVRIFNSSGDELYTLTQAGGYRGETFTMIGSMRIDNNNTLIQGFPGSIGDARVFNSVLTDSQIEAIFNATKSIYGI